MEATYSSEKSVNFQTIIWRYFPEDRTLHKRIREAGHVVSKAEFINSYGIRFLMRKTVGKRLFCRHKRIRMDAKDAGCENVNWIRVVQKRSSDRRM
jgi:hypothetical protein